MTTSAALKDQHTLRLERTFNVGVQTLFNCFTRPELLARWWGPEGVSCDNAELDLRPGGAYKFRMRGDDSGNIYVVFGEYVEVEAPERLVFTWSWEDNPDEVTLVTLHFAPVGEAQSRLILEHERFPSIERVGQHETGWSSSLDCLARVIQSA